MSKIINKQLSEKVLSYTSRGNKFVYHPEQISNFLKGNGKSIISTHIAPTNSCNLNCKYCNQSKRTRGAFLPLDTIKDFVTTLKERGLKAVIITGGGEPTLYPDFNKLINWLNENKLSTALITNGTNDKCGKTKVDTWDIFSWIRISLNFMNNKLRPLKIPENLSGKVGMSMVYQNQTPDMFREVADIAEKYDARFVRIIPDCCKDTEQIIKEREKLNEIISEIDSKRFFVQDKIPSQAVIPECHQSKLRPFLLPDGTVAPCDCYMLNKRKDGEYYKTLPEHFNLASNPQNPSSYVDYLDGKFKPKFNPIVDCNGCGFLENNEILQNMIDLSKIYPNKSAQELFEMLNMFPVEGINDINFV